MQTKELSVWAFLWSLVILPVVAQAATLHVNCDANKGLTRIQKAINQAGSEGPSTIVVSGSCKENVTIQSMDNLTLTAQNGASITDASNGTLDVMDVADKELPSGTIVHVRQTFGGCSSDTRLFRGCVDISKVRPGDSPI